MASPSRPSSLSIKDGAFAGSGSDLSAGSPTPNSGLSAAASGDVFVSKEPTAGDDKVDDFAGAAVEKDAFCSSWRSPAPDFVEIDVSG
jgi:hypothetical protein